MSYIYNLCYNIYIVCSTLLCFLVNFIFGGIMFKNFLFILLSFNLILLSACKDIDQKNVDSKLLQFNVTKDMLPTLVVACLNENKESFDIYFSGHDTGQSLNINNDGNFVFSLPTKQADGSCINKPYKVGNKLGAIKIDNFCLKNKTYPKEIELSPVSIGNNNGRILLDDICDNGHGDDYDYFIYSNGDTISNLNDNPEVDEVINQGFDGVLDVDLDLNNYQIFKQNDSQVNIYDFGTNTKVTSFNTNLEDYNLFLIMLTSNGLFMADSDNNKPVNLCSIYNKSCREVDGIGANKNISDNGQYLFSFIDDKLNYLNTITGDLKKDILKDILPVELFNDDIKRVTDSGAVLFNIDSNESDYMYSRQYNKVVKIENIIKSLGLGQYLVDGKFYGDLEISSNGKYLLFIFGQNDKWDKEYNLKVISVRRVYLEAGIDDMISKI